MGISFPNRVRRSHFGPKLVNNYPVENPQSDVGDVALNGDFSATAGMAGIIARASAVASWNGSSFDILHQQEAWNPDGNQAHPAFARSGAGRYSYTFAATYLDEDGVAVNTVLIAARATAQYGGVSNRAEANVTVDPTNPLRILIETNSVDANGTSAGADLRFWLEVL